ncbi:MAG TPA: hypothetical protein VLA01_03825 [Nitrosopumilaceae archaeon]|nr:hypothetical protein [Nitrosopumilaceae archaeon]
MKNSRIIFGFVSAVIFTTLMSTTISSVDAATNTEIIPLDGKIGIEKTILSLYASPDNTLPWGFVEGKIANHVSNYPVIIQIYNDDGDATHFAQTDVEEDGSYEYRFRVRNVDNGEVINIFEGNYSVKIFKVVYLTPSSNQI